MCLEGCPADLGVVMASGGCKSQALYLIPGFAFAGSPFISFSSNDPARMCHMCPDTEVNHILLCTLMDLVHTLCLSTYHMVL